MRQNVVNIRTSLKLFKKQKKRPPAPEKEKKARKKRVVMKVKFHVHCDGDFGIDTVAALAALQHNLGIALGRRELFIIQNEPTK